MIPVMDLQIADTIVFGRLFSRTPHEIHNGTASIASISSDELFHGMDNLQYKMETRNVLSRGI